MGKEQGASATGAAGGSRAMTRREVLAAGAVALVAGLGIVGCASAAASQAGAGAGGADAAAGAPGSASSSGASGSVGASNAAGSSDSAGAGSSGASGSASATDAAGTSGVSAQAKSTGSTGVSKGASTSSAASSSGTSAEANKARKFKEIPTESLITVDELHDLFETGDVKARKVYIIDIRSHRDYQNQLIEGSRNIPAGRQIEIRMSEIPQDKEVVLVALKNSNRLAETYFTLMANGYDPDLVKVLDGGVKGWADAGYPTLEDQFLGC